MVARASPAKIADSSARACSNVGGDRGASDANRLAEADQVDLVPG